MWSQINANSRCSLPTGNLGAKSNKNEKAKSLKDPNSEPSSLFQREGVHMLLGELSRKFPPQFLQQGQEPGNVKGSLIKGISVDLVLESKFPEIHLIWHTDLLSGKVLVVEV